MFFRPNRQIVQRTLQTAYIAGHHMHVNFRGLDIRVAEEFLKDADIDPVFQHVRSEARGSLLLSIPNCSVARFSTQKTRMGFTTEVMNITKYPLTTDLLCAIHITVISKILSNLVH